MSARLSFGPEQALSDLFLVPPDLTPWTNCAYDRTTPCRQRATFRTLGRALVPHLGTRTWKGHGIYVLAFSVPYPAIYIGLAVGEEFVGRLRKHRVKATGSHISDGKDLGGVNHTAGWRVLAVARYQHFSQLGSPDTLSDARVLLGHVQTSGAPNAFRQACADFEAALLSEGSLRDELLARLFKGVKPQPINRQPPKGPKKDHTEMEITFDSD